MSTSTTNDDALLRVAVIGRHAAKTLAGDGAGTVIAVFERSIHVAIGDGIVCVGGPVIGHGPLNAIVALPGSAAWPKGIEPGEAANVVGQSMRLSRWSFDYRAAALWQPQPWPRPADTTAMRAAFDHVLAIGRDRVPREGLSRLVLLGRDGHHDGLSDALKTIAAPRLAALDAWLGDRIGGRDVGKPPPRVLGLLGLGPGLTPSGDDVLCGVLVGLHAFGEHNIAGELAAAVLPAAEQATTALSRAFIAAATEGECGAALRAFIAVVIAARVDHLAVAIDDLGRIGHTSGWDALAGVVLAVRAYLAAREATRSP